MGFTSCESLEGLYDEDTFNKSPGVRKKTIGVVLTAYIGRCYLLKTDYNEYRKTGTLYTRKLKYVNKYRPNRSQIDDLRSTPRQEFREKKETVSSDVGKTFIIDGEECVLALMPETTSLY